MKGVPMTPKMKEIRRDLEVVEGEIREEMIIILRAKDRLHELVALRDDLEQQKSVEGAKLSLEDVRIINDFVARFEGRLK